MSVVPFSGAWLGGIVLSATPENQKQKAASRMKRRTYKDRFSFYPLCFSLFLGSFNIPTQAGVQQ